jgi:hypothetical protein
MPSPITWFTRLMWIIDAYTASDRGALVVMDGFHHLLQDRIENPARLFSVAVGKQLHRALEVGEQHSHLLALAFEGRLGGEDAFGKVLGGVGVRGAETRLGRRRGPQRLGTL